MIEEAMKKITPAFLIPIELSITFVSMFKHHFEGGKCPILQEVACIEMCIQTTHGYSIVLCVMCFSSP